MPLYEMRQGFRDLYRTWVDKAKEYRCNGMGPQECYDRFFTLYVAYNMLYTELAYKVKGKRNFRDNTAATKYAKEYLTARDFIAGIEQQPNCVSALDTIVCLLDGRHQPDGQARFRIVLDPCSGDPVEGADEKLLSNLTGRSRDHKSGAILTLIYNVRCNMFHGRKRFDQGQVILLRAVIPLLERVIEMLYDKLSSEGSQG